MDNEKMTERLRTTSDMVLLEDWLDYRFTIGAPGYADFPNTYIEEAAKAVRAEILRRMSFATRVDS